MAKSKEMNSGDWAVVKNLAICFAIALGLIGLFILGKNLFHAGEDVKYEHNLDTMVATTDAYGDEAWLLTFDDGSVDVVAAKDITMTFNDGDATAKCTDGGVELNVPPMFADSVLSRESVDV